MTLNRSSTFMSILNLIIINFLVGKRDFILNNTDRNSEDSSNTSSFADDINGGKRESHQFVWIKENPVVSIPKNLVIIYTNLKSLPSLISS